MEDRMLNMTEGRNKEEGLFFMKNYIEIVLSQ